MWQAQRNPFFSHGSLIKLFIFYWSPLSQAPPAELWSSLKGAVAKRCCRASGSVSSLPVRSPLQPTLKPNAPLVLFRPFSCRHQGPVGGFQLQTPSSSTLPLCSESGRRKVTWWQWMDVLQGFYSEMERPAGRKQADWKWLVCSCHAASCLLV